MMPELSLNILDVAQNSVTAGANLIEISIIADKINDKLKIEISDNGCGMTPEQVQRVTDPFFTTRTTRDVGLGVPFFKMAAELAGGAFEIKSVLGEGTTTIADFQLSHIDRMPLGDIASTMTALIGPNSKIDFVFNYSVDGKGFVMDTRQFKEVLGDIDIGDPEVLSYIAGFICENISDCGDYI